MTRQLSSFFKFGILKGEKQSDSCGKAFSQAGHLKFHINTVHNGQKDHKCDSCGKAFSQAAHLKGHINAFHNGQKYHKCDSCEKAFSQAGSQKNTLILFIMDKEITNVTHVERYFLKQET